MDSNVKHGRGPDGRATEPSVREHGLDGFTDEAVSSFGAGYDAQVAHGNQNEAMGERSDTELDASLAEASLAADQLADAVRKTLARAHIDAADLRVDVRGSQVHLRGTVRQSFEKAELEARARAVPGVAAVVSEISVQRAGWQEST